MLAIVAVVTFISIMLLVFSLGLKFLLVIFETAAEIDAAASNSIHQSINDNDNEERL